MSLFPSDSLILADGASSGIGRSVVLKLLEDGARVLGVARREDKLQEIKALHPDTFFFESCDLSGNPDGLSGLVDEWVKKYGRFSGYVHCAGVLNPQPLGIWDYQDALKDFNVNLFSAVGFIKGLAKKKNKQALLSIVLVSSIAAKIGNPGSISYAMTKAGLDNLVVSLTQEIGKQNIRINAVRPGWTDTALVKGYKEVLGVDFLELAQTKTPSGQAGKPEYIADVVSFLLSDRAYWIQGQTLTVDGAETCGA